VSCPQVITPFKKYQGTYTQFQTDYNIIHSYFRSTIEHVISQVKNFHILSNRFRGDINKLGTIVQIITAVIALQISYSPLKHLLQSIFSTPYQPIIRQYLLGFPFGTSSDFNIMQERGKIYFHGHGAASSNLDFGYKNKDFKRCQRILALWCGSWWKGTLMYISRVSETCTIKWIDYESTTSRYPSNLIIPARPAGDV